MSIQKIQLPSGATLEFSLASFPEGKALYKAVMKELRDMKFDMKADTDFNFVKELFCAAFSSDEIEANLWPCLGRCYYVKGANKTRINADVFEDESARQDWFTACIEVTKANLAPFVKGLSLGSSEALEALKQHLG